MITKNEAVAKYEAYQEDVRKKKIAATEEQKRQTINYCNNELSNYISSAAANGHRRIAIDTIHTCHETDECVTHIKTNNAYSTLYSSQRELHMPTLIKYVRQHGFTVKSENEEYNCGKGYTKKDASYWNGIKYWIEWA